MDLHSYIQTQKKLVAIQKGFPLALAKLWVPHCHRFDGLGEKSTRPVGCRQPMTKKAPGLYHCSTCNITEKRTSQKEAMIFTPERTATAIFGGNRSGKTQAGAMLTVAVAAGRGEWWVRQWLKLNNLPDSTVPNVRPSTVIASALSYGDAIAYIRPKLDLYLPTGTRRIRWNSQDRATAHLPNGGKIYSMSADSGREKYQGQSCELIWLDEEHPYPIFEEAQMRTIDSGISNGVILTMTPLLGFTWPADLFIQNPGNDESIVYHQISGLDNPYISSSKMMRTVNHMSDESKASRIFGHFTNQAGLVYPEFNRNIHIVDDIDISNRDSWDVFLTVDFGVVNPFACLAVAYHAKTDRLIVIDEHFATEKTTVQNGHAINAKFHRIKPFDYVICDPENKDGRMLLARQCNLHNHAAPKHLGVSQTINMVKERLALDAEGKPRLYVHRKCRNLLLEFRKYRWAKTTTGKDKPVKRDDHGLDALRYLVCWLARFQMHL